MPKHTVFTGACTAIVTPFRNGNVDYEAFGRLLDFQTKGVISVLSNLMPKTVHTLCDLCRNGNYDAASKLLLEHLPLIGSLFLQVNPVPVKTALARMGLCASELRLPLAEPEQEEADALTETMKRFHLL